MGGRRVTAFTACPRYVSDSGTPRPMVSAGMLRSWCDGCRTSMLVAAIALSAVGGGCDQGGTTQAQPQQRERHPADRDGEQAAAARDRRVGRVHRPLRRGRDGGDTRPRIGLPHRAAFQGRPGRQAGRPAVRARCAALRAHAGAGPGRAAAGPDQGAERQPRRRARQAAAGAADHLREDLRRPREPRARGAGGGQGGGGQGQDRRARAFLHAHHLADHRPHQPHAGDGRQLGERGRRRPTRRC